jgi:CubicO group peptidase (beta-lactamase class C family)
MDGSPGIGREFSGAGMNATLRDFARFGQMVLNGGMANGHRIVAQEWIRESTRPGKHTDERPGYGYRWWMVDGTPAFEAIGLQGQRIYVNPETATIVVKLSYYPPGDDSRLEREVAAFLAATSEWSPK